MKQHKGYYIDKASRNSEVKSDENKKQTIEHYKHICRMLAARTTTELLAIAIPYKARLHYEFGLSYKEIEQLENEAYAA